MRRFAILNLSALVVLATAAAPADAGLLRALFGRGGCSSGACGYSSRATAKVRYTTIRARPARVIYQTVPARPVRTLQRAHPAQKAQQKAPAEARPSLQKPTSLRTEDGETERASNVPDPGPVTETDTPTPARLISTRPPASRQSPEPADFDIKL